MKALRRVKPDLATFADVVEFAAIYTETNGAAPNDFYNLSQEYEQFRLVLHRQPVWDFLQELLVPKRFALDIGLRFITDKLKKQTPVLRTGCKSLIKGLGRRGVGKFDRDDFMSAVRRQQGHDPPVKNVTAVR